MIGFNSSNYFSAANRLPGLLVVGLVLWTVLMATGTGRLQAQERAASLPLSLTEAETLALEIDPLTRRFAATSQALSQSAIADGQLSDPQVKAGVMNLPEFGFSRTQEAMTQVQIGVRQAFPRGDTLSLRTRKGQELAAAETAKMKNQTLNVRLNVRQTWLNLYFLTRSLGVIEENKELFRQLINVTQSLYALGRNNQQDVLRAELELSLLEDRETEVKTLHEQANADLGKWIGPQNAHRPLSESFPELPGLPSIENIRTRLPDHPILKTQDAQLKASQTGVDLANELYKPKWMVDLTHGFRGGRNPDRSSRDDFLSLMVTMDVPIFTDKRQDRRVAASKHSAAAARLKRDDKLRNMTNMLERQHAAYLRLGERVALYDRAVLAQSQNNVVASIQAYESDVTDFSGLMRAQITELNSRLKRLELLVEQAKTKAALLYLAGGVYRNPAENPAGN